MATVDALRTAIVAVMLAVPDVGNVYDHVRYSAGWSNFLDNFGWANSSGENVVRGWWLSGPTISSGPTSTFDQLTDTYTFTVHGVMTYTDSSDTDATFAALVTAVRDKLYTQTTLAQGSAAVVPGSVELDAGLVDMRMFGSYLVHYCEMQLSVEVEQTPVVWGL